MAGSSDDDDDDGDGVDGAGATAAAGEATPKAALIVLVGIPGAGKTTFARRLAEAGGGESAEDDDGSLPHVQCVHFDHYIPEGGWRPVATSEATVHNGANPTPSPGGEQQVVQGVVAPVRDGHTLGCSPKGVVADVPTAAAGKGGAGTSAETFREWRAGVLGGVAALVRRWLHDSSGGGGAGGAGCGRVGCRAAVHVAVLDDNMHLRSMRREVYRLAGALGVGYLSVLLRCSEDVALARNAARSGRARLPDDVIRRMARALEPPDALSEHAWEAGTVMVETDLPGSGGSGGGGGGDLEVLAAAIRAARQPVELLSPTDTAAALERARATTRNSLAHQVDLAVRRKVAEWMSSAATPLNGLLLGRGALRDMGKAFAAEKRRLLDDLHAGRLDGVLEPVAAALSRAAAAAAAAAGDCRGEESKRVSQQEAEASTALDTLLGMFEDRCAPLFPEKLPS